MLRPGPALLVLLCFVLGCPGTTSEDPPAAEEEAPESEESPGLEEAAAPEEPTEPAPDDSDPSESPEGGEIDMSDPLALVAAAYEAHGLDTSSLTPEAAEQCLQRPAHFVDVAVVGRFADDRGRCISLGAVVDGRYFGVLHEGAEHLIAREGWDNADGPTREQIANDAAVQVLLAFEMVLDAPTVRTLETGAVEVVYEVDAVDAQPRADVTPHTGAFTFSVEGVIGADG